MAILLSFSLAKGQTGQFGLNNGSSIVTSPVFKTTNGLFNPFFPTSFSSSFHIEMAKDYVYRRNRAIIYGGNLCVAQSINSFGGPLGKWSFKGAWYQANYWDNPNIIRPVNVAQMVTPGVNYLVDYHRWGDYDAHFGLRERASDLGIYQNNEGGSVPTPPNAQQDIKDAVITWSHDFNRTPSRLIFQNVEGIVTSNTGPYPIIKEHATILTNGNMGIGTPTPSAHFEIKPNAANPSANAMNIINSSNNSSLLINSIGNVGINNPSPQEKLDVTGKIKVNGDILLNGQNSYHSTRMQINPPTGYINSEHLLKVTTGANDLLNISGNGFNSTVPNFNVSSDQVNFTDANSFEATGKTTFRVPAPIGFPYDKAFDVQYQNGGNSLMYLQNDGQMYLKGSVYAYTPSPSGIDNALFIDNDGKVYADNVLPLNKNNFWQVGGNQFNITGTSMNFGTTNNNSIKIIANSTDCGTIIGNQSNKLGFLEYRKPVAFGGYTGLYPDAVPEFAMTIKSTRTPTQPNNFNEGILNCINSSGDPILIVGNQTVNIAGHGFNSGGVVINNLLEVDGDIIPKINGINGPYNLGQMGNIFNEIWGTGGNISSSDKRLKTNIEPLNLGLETILKLKSYSYNYKSNLNRKHYGFIAQEIKDFFPNAIVAGAETDSTYLGVRYDEIVPLLTKGIQEQQQIIDTLKQQINMLLIVNKSKENIGENKEQKVVLNQLPILFQNHPNPFNGFTFIDYFLPPNANNAFIRVVDNNGKLIKAFPLNSKGYGQVELDCTNISAGTYHYTLLVDAQVIDTKSMIVAASN